MIRSGLVSISFRSFSAERIIEVTRKCALAAIEWGGDVHVPHGDVETAKRIGRLTREAGIDVAAYGSYYKLGESEKAGLSFKSVLDSTVAMEAPTVRVWAGSKGTADADDAHWGRIVEDAQRIADLAAEAGKRVCYEYHQRTLTDHHESAIKLHDLVGKDNVDLLWQPPFYHDFDTNLASLKAMLSRVSNIHVYWWTASEADGIVRYPLAEGQSQWQAFFDVLAQTDKSRYAMLEYVLDDTEVQLEKDAKILNTLVAGLNRAG